MLQFPIHQGGLYELDRKTFNKLIEYQLVWNRFVFDNSTRDLISDLLLCPLAGQDVLCNQLESLIDLDPCPIKCFFLRNDYFKTPVGVKIVEYNTTSVAFLSSSQVVSEELGGEICTGLTKTVEFLVEACKMHANHYKLASEHDLCILMLVTKKDLTNGNCDQELLAQNLRSKGIKVIKCSFGKDLSAKTGPDGHCFIGDQLINLVYLRAGYTPFEPEELEQRKEIEATQAVKVNSINIQLFGMKLVQANLTSRKIKPADFDKLAVETCQLSKYTGLLDGKILKNNKEGGGSCQFEGISEFAQTLTDKEKKGWIVMEKLNPIVHHEKYVSEIGIGGAVLSLNGEIIKNEYLGYLIRTKEQTQVQGGVAGGFAKINSLKIT
jgi:hypothetical protein